MHVNTEKLRILTGQGINQNEIRFMETTLDLNGCTFYAVTLSKVSSLGQLGRVSLSPHLQRTATKKTSNVVNEGL